METLLRDLQPPPQPSDERHQFLLVDNPSVEVTSNLHSGYANIPEAAQTVDVVRALLPAMEKGASVLVVVGCQLQCAVLEKGWPQSGRSIAGSLGQARNKDQGDGKGELIGPSDPPLHP
eukprot:4702684-Pyramimonas_sp.AAC.1